MEIDNDLPQANTLQVKELQDGIAELAQNRPL